MWLFLVRSWSGLLYLVNDISIYSRSHANFTLSVVNFFVFCSDLLLKVIELSFDHRCNNYRELTLGLLYLYRNKHIWSFWAPCPQKSDWSCQLIWSCEANHLHHHWTWSRSWGYHCWSLKMPCQFVILVGFCLMFYFLP